MKKTQGSLLVGTLALSAVLWGCSQAPEVKMQAGAIAAGEEAVKFGVGSYVLGEGNRLATVFDVDGNELGELFLDTRAAQKDRSMSQLRFLAVDGTVLDSLKVTRKKDGVAAFVDDVTDQFTAIRTDPALNARFLTSGLNFVSAAKVEFTGGDELAPEYKQVCNSTVTTTAVSTDPHCDQYSCTPATGNAADGFPKNGNYNYVIGNPFGTIPSCTVFCTGLGYDSGVPYNGTNNRCTCTGSRSEVTMGFACGAFYSNCAQGKIESFTVKRNCTTNVDACTESNKSAYTCVNPTSSTVANNANKHVDTGTARPCPYACPAGYIGWDYAYINTTTAGGCEPVYSDCTFVHDDGSGYPVQPTYTHAPIPGTRNAAGLCTYEGILQPVHGMSGACGYSQAPPCPAGKYLCCDKCKAFGTSCNSICP